MKSLSIKKERIIVTFWLAYEYLRYLNLGGYVRSNTLYMSKPHLNIRVMCSTVQSFQNKEFYLLVYKLLEQFCLDVDRDLILSCIFIS